MIWSGHFRNGGFTLIETLVGVSVFVIVTTSIFGSFLSIIEISSATRQKNLANLLANNQIELARGLNYVDVGVVGGAPSGILQAVETKQFGALNYGVVTSVIAVDDPFDGLAPNDIDPDDYRKITVRVDCSDCLYAGAVAHTTNIAR